MEKPVNLLKKIYEPSKEVKKRATIKDYDKVYHTSVENREAFWATEAKKLEWYKILGKSDILKK